jgi:hypothetical protein
VLSLIHTTLQFTTARTISSLGAAWQRIPTISSASVHTSLPAGYHRTTSHQLATPAHPAGMRAGNESYLIMTVGQTAAVEGQHSHSWLQVSSRLLTKISVLSWTCTCLRNWASSSTRGGVGPSVEALRLLHRRLSNSESGLLYDWRFTANQFVLAPSLLRLMTSFF